MPGNFSSDLRLGARHTVSADLEVTLHNESFEHLHKLFNHLTYAVADLQAELAQNSFECHNRQNHRVLISPEIPGNLRIDLILSHLDQDQLLKPTEMACIIKEVIKLDKEYSGYKSDVLNGKIESYKQVESRTNKVISCARAIMSIIGLVPPEID